MVDSAQPFDGIRVVEFGQFVAVPFCAQLLAEGGAEVIKIESLTGDPTRGLRQIAPFETRIFISRNRGKHSLPLNLSHAEAKPVLDALLGWADVALMNFRPGLAEKIGLGAESLHERFPRLVIGSVTAFGKHGPDAGFAGMDIVVQARSGLMAANGRIVDGRPAPGDPVSADYMTAMSLAFGVSAALLRREKTGRGGIIDTSLMQAAITLANNQLVRSEEHDAPVHAKVLERLAAQRADHASYEEQLEALPSARTMPLLKVYFRTYETADAVIAVACGSLSLREKFMQALGLNDDALHQADDRGWAEHYDALRDTVEAMMREQPSATWMDRLQALGVPVSTVKFPLELFDDPHVAANGMLHRLEHPTAGDFTVPAPPVSMDGDGFRPTPPTPPFGSETKDLLQALGFAEETIDALVAQGVTRSE